MTPVAVYYNIDEKTVIVFNQTNNDLITGHKQKPSDFAQFLDNNSLGSKEWIKKWGNN